MSIKEKALELHKKGYNCAQAVIAACSDMTGLDEKTALAISAGFGGGLRSGEVCGAISGAVMAVAAAAENYGKVRCAELKGNIDCNEIICFMAETAEKIIKE